MSRVVLYFFGSIVFVFVVFVLLYYLPMIYADSVDKSSAEKNQWLISDFDPVQYQLWNQDVNFSGLLFTTGRMKKAIYFEAINGRNSWGAISFAWSFTQPYLPISQGEITIKNDTAFVYAKHSHGRSFGVSSLTQGNIWAPAESTKWYCPSPLQVTNKKIVLDFETCVDEAWTNPLVGPFQWLMMGINVWYRSPKLSKPLVMDLMFFHEGVVWTKEDKEAYHYQYVLDRGRKNINQWKRFTIDLNWFINKALERFKIEYAKDDLEIVEIDILVETMYGKGAFRVKKFGLYYQNQ